MGVDIPAELLHIFPTINDIFDGKNCFRDTPRRSRLNTFQLLKFTAFQFNLEFILRKTNIFKFLITLFMYLLFLFINKKS